MRNNAKVKGEKTRKLNAKLNNANKSEKTRSQMQNNANKG